MVLVGKTNILKLENIPTSYLNWKNKIDLFHYFWLRGHMRGTHGSEDGEGFNSFRTRIPVTVGIDFLNTAPATRSSVPYTARGRCSPYVLPG